MILKNQKNSILSMSVYSLTLLLSFYYGLILNIPLFVKFIIPQLKTSPFLIVLSIPLIFILIINTLFNLLNWKYFLKPFFILLTLLSSIIFYATYSFGTIFDKSMIHNIYETNMNESLPFVTFNLFCWFIIFGVIPSLFIYFVKVTYPPSIISTLKKNALQVFGSFFLALGLLWFNYKEISFIARNSDSVEKLICPFYALTSLEKYLKKSSPYPTPYKQLGLDAKIIRPIIFHKPTLFILVVGETARSHNFSLNGYLKKTNPFTENLNVISFRNVISCGTSTAVSVPCMFSKLNRDNYDPYIAENQDGLLDILNHAGISLRWSDNQAGCKNVCDRIPHENSAYTYDQELLKKLTAMTGDGQEDRVMIFHLMGSHGPNYYERYPVRHAYFKPECRRGDVQNCTHEEITNSYDNTILSTDYFLASLIKKLIGLEKRYNTAMLYISDHGESLGEQGLYLHGMPYKMAPDYQKRVPMIMWFSPSFSNEKKLNLQCLQEEAINQHFSHDHLFHSVLGLLNIQTAEYNPKLDLFNPCRNSV